MGGSSILCTAFDFCVGLKPAFPLSLFIFLLSFLFSDFSCLFIPPNVSLSLSGPLFFPFLATFLGLCLYLPVSFSWGSLSSSSSSLFASHPSGISSSITILLSEPVGACTPSSLSIGLVIISSCCFPLNQLPLDFSLAILLLLAFQLPGTCSGFHLGLDLSRLSDSSLS